METAIARKEPPPEADITQRAEALYISLTAEEQEQVNRYLYQMLAENA